MTDDREAALAEAREICDEEIECWIHQPLREELAVLRARIVVALQAARRDEREKVEREIATDAE